MDRRRAGVTYVVTAHAHEQVWSVRAARPLGHTYLHLRNRGVEMSSDRVELQGMLAKGTWEDCRDVQMPKPALMIVR